MLYFVGTPIGNLNDFSKRAIDVLSECDIVACEDTRVTKTLISHYNINKKMISYNKNNENASAQGIIALLNEGKNVCVVSDSGMPLISDPGNTLAKVCKQNSIAYSVVPGPNAGLCALILSGLDSSRFSFVGFLPEQNSEKKKLFNEIKNLKMTLIFHISPHSLKKDLQEIYLNLGRRKASLVKEITKIFETAIDFELGDEIEVDERGEFVLVVEGSNEQICELNSLTIDEHIDYYVSLGNSKKEAIKLVAKDRNVNKNKIYQKTIT